MSAKISKTQIKEKIENFFKEIKSKNPKEVKKIKKLAMSSNISLKEKRKTFCKKCFEPYSGKEKIRIKSDHKIIECLSCGNLNKMKMNF